MRLSPDIPKAIVWGITLSVTCFGVWAREHPPQSAQVVVHAGRAGCQVQLDNEAVGITEANGNLLIPDVEPGDHYIHVDCPGQVELAYFISPRADEKLLIQASNQAAQPAETAGDPSSVAERKIELRHLVQQAVQHRAQGHLDEAVTALRQAMQLDPENSDLHREMGITFLLGKEWKRARIEMIEAIRHDQTDADAHNGLGYALEKLGDLDGAVKEYRAATNLDPSDATYRTHYFDALVKIAERQERKK
jgi:tetratricopeptide (TPR) repeat protein